MQGFCVFCAYLRRSPGTRLQPATETGARRWHLVVLDGTRRHTPHPLWRPFVQLQRHYSSRRMVVGGLGVLRKSRRRTFLTSSPSERAPVRNGQLAQDSLTMVRGWAPGSGRRPGYRCRSAWQCAHHARAWRRRIAIAHPGVTSALLGPHTMEQLDDLLAGFDVTLTDEILDRIDEIVPPGTDVGTLDQADLCRALQSPSLRRRPVDEHAPPPDRIPSPAPARRVALGAAGPTESSLGTDTPRGGTALPTRSHPRP